MACSSDGGPLASRSGWSTSAWGSSSAPRPAPPYSSATASAQPPLLRLGRGSELGGGESSRIRLLLFLCIGGGGLLCSYSTAARSVGLIGGCSPAAPLACAAPCARRRGCSSSPATAKSNGGRPWGQRSPRGGSSRRTQDLLYAFSSVPRELNFIDHTSDLGWKEHGRFENLIVDPSLYMDRNTEHFPATETRQMPDAFKIFTGSPWVMLSRNFTEHCVHGHGWDNLPRKLLMYFANTAYSMKSYFQTVICNSSDFRNTTVNDDLRYFVWDDPPGLEPLILDESHFDNMVNSSAAFARRFVENATVLKKVDDELLNRSSVQLVPGVWCPNLGEKQGGMDVHSCSKWGDINIVRPGRAGERLRRFISEISQTRGCS